MEAPPRPPRQKPDDPLPASGEDDEAVLDGLYAKPDKSRDNPPKLFASRLAANRNAGRKGPSTITNVALTAHKLPTDRSGKPDTQVPVKTDEDYIYSAAISTAGRGVPEPQASSRTSAGGAGKRGPKTSANVALTAQKLHVDRPGTLDTQVPVKTDEDYIYSAAISTAGRGVPEPQASSRTFAGDDRQVSVKTDEDYIYGTAISTAGRGVPKPQASSLTTAGDDRQVSVKTDEDYIYGTAISTAGRGVPEPQASSLTTAGDDRQVSVKTDEDYIYGTAISTAGRGVPKPQASSLTTAGDVCDDGDGFIYDEPKSFGRLPTWTHETSTSQRPRETEAQVNTEDDIYNVPTNQRRVPKRYVSSPTTEVEAFDDGVGFVYDEPKSIRNPSTSQHPPERQAQCKAKDYYIYDVPTNRRRVPSRQLNLTAGSEVRFNYDIAKPLENLTMDDTTCKSAATRSRPALRVTTRKKALAGAEQGTRSPKPLVMTHSLNVEDDQIKVVLELKSREKGETEFSRVPMRLVCLFDISGSMGQQFGSKTRRRETKIVKMRNIAKLITNTMHDEDYLGVIAFGNDTEVLSPMTQNEPSAKKEVLSKVRELGRNGLSLTTNLSRGLFAAIEMFRQDSKARGLECFDSRDVIIVLTDGDINDGITDGQELVRQVRQAIRELEMEGNQYSKDPSLTISTVVTGNNLSEAVYMLSKTCGNDAFFYIEKDTDHLEIGALMPVLLRMNSVANCISVQAEALDPAELLPKECSHEYMAHRPHERDDEICYFLHDLGLGMSKHLLVVLDKESVMCETDMDAAVLRVKVEYRDTMMEKHSFTHEVMRTELEDKTRKSVAVSIQDIRRISQLVLRQVAEDIKEEKKEKAVAHLLQSIEEVETQVEKQCRELGVLSEKQQLTHFVQSVVANLTNLMTVIEDSQKTTGNKWSAVKSVSSAIVREAPSATRLLGQQKELSGKASLPREVSEIRRNIRDQYTKNGVKSAIFYDFDVTMMELTNSLRGDARLPCYQDESLDVTCGGEVTDHLQAEPSLDDVYVYSAHMPNN